MPRSPPIVRRTPKPPWPVPRTRRPKDVREIGPDTPWNIAAALTGVALGAVEANRIKTEYGNLPTPTPPMSRAATPSPLVLEEDDDAEAEGAALDEERAPRPTTDP